MAYETSLNTTWNGIKNIADFTRQWPMMSADMGVGSVQDIMAKPSCDSGIDSIDDLTEPWWYHEISGKYVSELDQAFKLFRNDLFLISQNRQISAGSSVKDWQSRKLQYKELSSQLFIDILGGLKLKSMAYREKYEFALSSHNHDDIYSRVDIRLNPKYDKNNSAYIGDDNTINICSCYISTDYLTCVGHTGSYQSITCNPAHISAHTKTVIIKVPKITPPIPPRPMIGTMRFVASATLQKLIDENALITQTQSGKIQVNPYAADNTIRTAYDGWVFANGTTIQNRNGALSAAAAVYGESATATSFSVPDITRFFKPNPGMVSTPAVVVPSQAGLKQHAHEVGTHTFNGPIELDHERSQMISTGGAGGGVYVHNGDANSTYRATVTSTATISFEGSTFTGLSTTTASDIQTPYPTHRLIPIMIYIGGETVDYYESLYAKYNE